MSKQIIRGDSYETSRPLYQYSFLDDTSGPLDLTGCDIMITYKPVITAIEDDSTDATAVIKHELKIGAGGSVEFQQGIYLVGTIADGTVEQRLTPTETTSLPVGVILYGDIQLIDANGEVFTWIFEETLLAIDGVTNREAAS